MATDHDPSALDVSAGGVPRHASAKERKTRGLGPFLSDLKAEVRSQLSRAEVPGRVPQVAAGPGAPGAPIGTVPDTAYAEPAEHYPTQPFAQPSDDAAALVAAALATADHAGAEAAAARDEAAAARDDAGAARADAAAARAEAASALATVARSDAQLAAARAEIEAAHREFETLRAEFDAAQERGRRNVLIAWVGAGAAAVLAAVALVLGFV
ncbi:hypothetical protein [Promicromonospora sukumoe]|uniref:hypothetical protein n=1 Tax=Promicromonospora sukumoe TaxID=88382 RepID=UPI0003786FE2|nr:hypothetical protein [Promicromonospora sukumoe]